jgi:short-subunit dehydrogenase
MQVKTIWLTGASSGIGAALARLLATQGHRLAISSRSAERLQAVAGQQENIDVFPLDVTDRAAVKACVDSIEKQLGAIDWAILNAGDYTPMPLSEFSVEQFEKINKVNYLSAVYCLESLLPYFQQRRSGSIIFTASLAGYRGLPKAAPYNASKAALISLAESLYHECRVQGITIRVINPGFVQTPLTAKNQFAMPQLLTPEQAALAISKQLKGSHFEITFPQPFAWFMNLLRILPYSWFFALTKGAAQ